MHTIICRVHSLRMHTCKPLCIYVRPYIRLYLGKKKKEIAHVYPLIDTYSTYTLYTRFLNVQNSLLLLLLLLCMRLLDFFSVRMRRIIFLFVHIRFCTSSHIYATLFLYNCWLQNIKMMLLFFVLIWGDFGGGGILVNSLLCFLFLLFFFFFCWLVGSFVRFCFVLLLNSSCWCDALKCYSRLVTAKWCHSRRHTAHCFVSFVHVNDNQ